MATWTAGPKPSPYHSPFDWTQVKIAARRMRDRWGGGWDMMSQEAQEAQVKAAAFDMIQDALCVPGAVATFSGPQVWGTRAAIAAACGMLSEDPCADRDAQAGASWHRGWKMLVARYGGVDDDT